MGGKGLILLVEDDGQAAEELGARLNGAGYDILAAESGETAQRLAAERKADLAILATHLGQGESCAAAVWQLLSEHGLTLLFLSSCDEEEPGAELLDIPCYGFLTREACTALLDASIQAALKLWSLRQAQTRTRTRLEAELHARQRSMEALRADLDQLQLVLDHAPLALSAIDHDGRFLLSEGKGLAAIGQTPGQVVQHSVYEVFQAHPEVLDHVRTALQGKAVDTTLELAGQTLEVHYEPILDEARQVAAVAAVSTVITERRRAEEQLRLNEARLSAILSSARDAIGVSQQGIHILANPAYLRMFGYDHEEELTGKSVLDLIAPDSRSLVQRNIQLRQEQRAPALYEVNALRRDGTAFPMEVSASSYELDGKKYTLVTLRDLSALKQAQADQAESEERYRALFSNLPGGFALHEIVCDAQGKPCDYRFLEINAGFERLTGLKREAVIGRLCSQLLPDEDPIWVQRYGEVALGGEPSHFTNFSPALKRYFEVYAYRPAPRQFAVLFMDVTAHKQTEEALRRLLREKELLMQELQHRVKNSLSVAASLVGLEMQNLPDERARAIFTNTHARLASMAAIYEQLYRSGGIDRVDLGRYIQALIKALSSSYISPSRPIRIETSLENIQVDLQRALPLGIILNELITNALKYAFPEQRIAAGAGLIQVKMLRAGEQVSLCVSDDGIGFAGDAPPNQGMGLGLVQILARQLDGDFCLHGEGGCQACLSFTLE